MALAVAVVFVHQVHLNIADLGTAAQIILAHQAVEIDGRGRTRIGLVISDFRHSGEIGAQVMQHPFGLFHTGAFRHVDHHLKFGLVVEGQHLHHHQLKHGQAHR